MSARTPQRVSGLDVAWAVFSLAMLVQMYRASHDVTTPYHLLWAVTILVYGFRLWPPRVLYPLLGLLTVVSGLSFVRLYLAGRTGLHELSEIPLMPMAVGFGAWHAWRRSQAQLRVQDLAERERSRLERQREFLRDASHAIRTPVTIARGHVELIAMRGGDAQVAADSAEVLHQLDRLNHLAGRLLAIEHVLTAGDQGREDVDVAGFVAKAGRRWSAAAPRRWVVDAAPAGVLRADLHRLEESLDALVENALRFTSPDDAVRISCRADGAWTVLEVADSGPGIAPEDRSRAFERFFHQNPKGQEPGTGLGLALVQAVVTAHGGTVVADAAPEGGALLTVRLPVRLPVRPG